MGGAPGVLTGQLQRRSGRGQAGAGLGDAASADVFGVLVKTP